MTDVVNKGFFEVNSKSTISDSIPSRKEESPVDSTGNHSATNNRNIEHIFGREDLIETYLESVAVQNSDLVLARTYKTLLRHDHETLVDCVKILSGGAATTDPLYSGSIGVGMLTGAVYGELKKSPPSLTILEVLRIMAHKNKEGILVIVLNNLANRLNFGSACQSAAQEGIKTLLVNVGEDVSGVSVSKAIGRRGLVGIKFLYKIAGAMSEEKKTLFEIHHAIETLKGKSLGTISIGIRPDAMVIGPGHKGETEKLCFLWNTFDDIGETARLTFIVRQAMSHLFHPSSYFSLHVVKGDEIAVIINNLGKLSDLHLNVIVKEVLDQINKLEIKVMRIYCGRYLNSNSAGFSISVLKVKDNILELLDRPASVTAWPARISAVTVKPKLILDESGNCIPYSGLTDRVRAIAERGSIGPKFTKQQSAYLLDILPKVVETIEHMKEYLNRLDNDHDFGTIINKFANGIKTEIHRRTLKIVSPYDFLDHLAHLAGSTMGGVSGGIFSILFSSAAQAFLGLSPMVSPNMDMWVNAARAARDGLMRYTRVKPGDGTILDALNPFVESQIEDSVKAMSMRVSAAMKGAEDTSSKSSRSSKAPRTDDNVRNVVSMEEADRSPDPGALCLAAVIRTIFTCVQIELAEAEAEAEAAAKAAEAAAAAAAAALAELKVKESKNPDLKEADSKFEKRKEDSQSTKDFSQLSTEEKSSVNIAHLQEVLDEIAKEIEDEITDENN